MVLIRPMQAEDLPQVYEIDRLSFSMPWPEGSYQVELDNPVSICRVADLSRGAREMVREGYRNGEAQAREKSIVGFLVAWLVMDEVQIASFAVHPEFRHQGIAREMLEDILCLCSSLGARTATLEVRAHNESAQMLYQGFGFEVVGVRPGYYADNHEDAYIMTRHEIKLNPDNFV